MFAAIKELFFTFGRLFKWWVVIAPWEQCIRVRLGKHTRVFGAGIHLKIPYVDLIYKQSTRRRVTINEVQTLSTRDGKAVTLSSQVLFEIGDIGLLYKTLHQVEDVIGATVASTVAEFIWSHDLVDCSPEQIQAHLAEKLDFSKYGIANVEAYLINFAAVRTYRLIMDKSKEWTLNGDGVNTDQSEGRY